MHLIMDGKCSNMELLTSSEALAKFLRDTAKLVGMTVHEEPIVKDYPWPDSKGTALSGVCFLAESSITVHTYPEFSQVFIDIFSCKSLDPVDKIIAWIKEAVGMVEYDWLLLERGVHAEQGYPLRTYLLDKG